MSIAGDVKTNKINLNKVNLNDLAARILRKAKSKGSKDNLSIIIVNIGNFIKEFFKK